MTGTDPRRLAAAVLLDVAEGRYSDEALARALENSGLSDADRGLTTQLVYGTLSRQRTLDYTIETRSARPLDRIDLPVLIAIRLGLFQLGFLDRIPDHAAVATSVELIARHGAGVKGFVNALLRRTQREGLVGPPLTPEVTRLGVLHSHPDWLVRMWMDELGDDEAEALLDENNRAAPTCYRALGSRENALRALEERGLVARAGLYASSAIVVDGPARRLEHIAVAQGEASQLVVELLAPSAGSKVLDACAAPGGKTAAIAARVGAGGRVLACDPAARAAERVRASLEAAGVGGRVTFRNCRVEELGDEATGFDAALVDAPCSGLGTLRQHPEIRWRRTPRDLDDLAARQRSALAAAAGRLRRGGTLVYSTCTIARCENEEVVEAFLGDHPGFRVDETAATPGVQACLDSDGALRTWPQHHGIDGFFAVRMIRED